MKVSLDWMKWYGGKGLDVPIKELAERIGAQLGAVEEVENLGEKYQGVIVVKVVECKKHEDSDHLNVCKIDDGHKAQDVERDENGLIQVVCGAPNVREGMLVAWLPPGSTVPESVGKDPFVLGSRELRGVMSNGMLASPKELALGESHEGILELDGEVKPGDDFAKAYGLDDYIIEIENKMFTHRPDCFGILGVAREIAGISGQTFTSPEWYRKALPIPAGEGLPLHVRNELPGLVPRFMVVPMQNVTVKPSPLWLQTYLLRSGVRPINNVVDITNYMMLLSGQPLHAYDYDKVKALNGSDDVTLYIRNPHDSERITLLNGKEISPRPEAIMVATEHHLLGLGGIMGGSSSEVSDDTRNIIVECANFDMFSIRRSSMAHGLFTDAVTRFNKGQSPLQNEVVLAKAVQMLMEFASAQPAGPMIDDFQGAKERAWVHPPVPVTTSFINERLGLDLSAETMQILLTNVEFDVTIETDKLVVSAPFWRTDIETREDVVEEIGRLYGFDKLPLVLPRRSIKPAHQDQLLQLKAHIRQVLAKAGANEALTYSFVHGDLLDKVQQDKSLAFQVGNALSPDLQYYRLSLVPSLLDKVHMNSKAGYGSFALFEIGKAHAHTEREEIESAMPKERQALSLVYASKQATQLSPYYQAKRIVLELLDEFHATAHVRFVPLNEVDLGDNIWLKQMAAPFEPQRSAVLVDTSDHTSADSPTLWGVVGEFKPAVRKALKLPEATAGFEIDPLLLIRPTTPLYVPLPHFPRVNQDITLVVEADMPYQQLYDFVWSELQTIQPAETLPYLDLIDIYQSTTDTAHKAVTLRYSIASYQRTLSDADVTPLLDAVAAAAQQAFGAVRG